MRIPGGWWKRGRRKNREEPGSTEEESPKEQWYENPYLPWMRQILCDILPQRGLSYQTLRLAVLDTDEDEEIIFWEDMVLQVLNDLAEDLNGLLIFTRRPAYFQEYVERMYEENGLLVQIWEKGRLGKKGFQAELAANTLLDFERQGGVYQMGLREPALYIPIYKKPWKTAENLDILVPIGYNTVIVRGIKEERC